MKFLASSSLVLLAMVASQSDAFAPSSSSNLLSRTSISSTARSVANVQEVASDVSAAASTKSWQDDGFVFGLADSGLERPTGKQAFIAVEGDDLETKPYQVKIVQATFLAHLGFLSWSFSQMLVANGGNVAMTIVQSLLLLVSSWVLADFGSGVLHWSVDNYGNGKTPIMGGIIAAFQGHHTAPWTIAERGFCNNVFKLCLPFGILPMALISTIVGPFSVFFWTTFCAFEILSQEFHKWSHQLKSETPSYVNVLQNLGLTVSRKQHAQHHLAPYEGNYCIISGVCNSALDQSGVFRWMEHQVYKLNSVESNAWKLDPELKARTLRGDYGLPELSSKKIG